MNRVVFTPLGSWMTHSHKVGVQDIVVQGGVRVSFVYVWVRVLFTSLSSSMNDSSTYRWSARQSRHRRGQHHRGEELIECDGSWLIYIYELVACLHTIGMQDRVVFGGSSSIGGESIVVRSWLIHRCNFARCVIYLHTSSWLIHIYKFVRCHEWLIYIHKLCHVYIY